VIGEGIKEEIKKGIGEKEEMTDNRETSQEIP
jgi:hypothetical protein